MLKFIAVAVSLAIVVFLVYLIHIDKDGNGCASY